MAMNPMQRKARNSFLLGMLITLILTGIVIGILIMQINGMKEKEDALAKRSKTVCMLTEDIKSGQTIDASKLRDITIETDIATDNIIKKADLTESTIAKVDMPKGTFLAKSMILTSDEKTTDDLREQEYNVILLPTDLSKEDYIDIRIRFSNGQDYIVVSKKRVLKSSQNTVFLKMNEDEILTMSNAIVDSYISKGSLIYADKYESPGIQKAATSTYIPNQAVIDLLNSDSNITEKAMSALKKRIETNGGMRNSIDSVLSDVSEQQEQVESGIQEEILKQEAERSRYISAMGEGADY